MGQGSRKGQGKELKEDQKAIKEQELINKPNSI